MPNVLQVNDLKVYLSVDAGTVKAADGVSFRIPEGRTVALVGESGSGKSIIAQAVMGILPKIARIESGEILFSDPSRPGTVVDIAKLRPSDPQQLALRGGRISIIFQEPMTALSPLHTVGNQIEEALTLHRDLGKVQRQEAVVEILRLVGFPNPARAVQTYPFELSGGLRQRAMIAMALVCRPALLVADEPTTALDVTIQAQILQLIIQLQREMRMAVMMITHDLGVVANMAEEVVVLYHGKVVEAGPVEAIFRTPGHPYLKALMRAVPRFNMAPGERLTPLREIQVSTNHLMSARPRPPADKASDEPLLTVRNLTKGFGTRKASILGGKAVAPVLAVDDVSFDVDEGQVFSIIGPNGAGKTTLFNLISRLYQPTTGRIEFRGEDVTRLSAQEIASRGIAGA